MSRRTSRWLLWAAFAFTIPLPVLIIGPGLVPAARLVMLGGISAAVMLFSCSGGVVGTLTAVLLGQALIYLGVLWLAAGAVARLLASLSRRGVALWTAAVIAALVLGGSAFEIYHTPFAPDAPRANLPSLLR